MVEERPPAGDRPRADLKKGANQAGAEDSRLGRLAAAVDAIAHARDDRYRETKARAAAKRPA